MTSKTSKKQGRVQRRPGLTGAIKSAAPRGILPSSLRGLAAALICCAALMFVASAIVYSTADPNRYVTPASLTVLYISCFCGGLVAAKCNRGAALVCGTLVSVMLLTLLFVASFLLDPSLSAEHSLPLAIGLRGIAIALSILGALVGGGEKKKKKQNRKK